MAIIESHGIIEQPYERSSINFIRCRVGVRKAKQVGAARCQIVVVLFQSYDQFSLSMPLS